MNNAGQGIRIFLQEVEPGLFGYDIEVGDAAATVGAYIEALDDFQARTLADCRGCDGCCHERAPLTWADYFLAGTQQEPADWLEETAELFFIGQAVDIRLARGADGACRFLDREQKCCRRHQRRGITCRSHCCLPKSERAEELRAAIINAGEDELVRQVLAAERRPWGDRLANVRAEDYAANGFSHRPGADWRQVPLRELVGAELWRKLQPAGA